MRNWITKRLKSRTHRIALLMGTLAVLEAHLQVLLPLLPEGARPFAPLAMALVMMWMREQTTTPVGDRHG